MGRDLSYRGPMGVAKRTRVYLRLNLSNLHASILFKILLTNLEERETLTGSLRANGQAAFK